MASEEVSLIADSPHALSDSTARASGVIALVGLPGSGKSTIGRHLARRLQLELIDTDALIEKRLGETIRAFFEREGEERFRQVEHETLRDALTHPRRCVMATGGGIVLREDNRRLLARGAIVVYLRSSPEDLARRLRHDRQRPLLQVAHPLAKLRELYRVRDPLYREVAHFTVETGRPSVALLTQTIATQLELGGLWPPQA